MKLPLVVAQQEVAGQFNQPEASLGLAALPGRAAAQAGQVVSQGAFDSAAIYTAAQQKLRAADASLEAQKGIDDLSVAVEQRKIELAQNPVHPDDYVPELVKTMTERGSAIATNMRYPEAQQQFMRASRHYLTMQVKEAQWDALAQHNGIVEQDFMTKARDWANAAVYAKKANGDPDLEARARAKAQFSAEATKLSAGNKPVIDPTRMAKIREDWNQQVQVNELFRDGRDPQQRQQIVEDLRAGRYPMIRHPDEFADTLTRRWQEDEDRLDRKREHDQAVARVQGFSKMYDTMKAGGYKTAADLYADPTWALLDYGEKDRIEKDFKNPGTGKSDPNTLIALTQNVYDPSGPKWSAGRIQQLMDTKGPDGAPLLNTTDGKEALVHIQSWQTQRRNEYKADTHRAEDQTRADHNRRYSEQVQIGRVPLARTGAAAERLNPMAQYVQGRFMDEMNRRSLGAGEPTASFPRNEDPEAVRVEILPRLMEELMNGGEAGPGVKQDYESITKAIQMQTYKTPEALKAAKGRIPDDQWLEQYKRFEAQADAKKDWDRLQQSVREALEKQRKR